MRPDPIDSTGLGVMRKQHLAKPSTKPDVEEVARGIGGLHATDPTTPYLSLFARMHGFSRERLDVALFERKSLGRIRCMRNTVYILPLEQIPAAFAATRRMTELNAERFCKSQGVTVRQFTKISRKIEGALEDGGMTVKEIRSKLGSIAHLSSIVNLMSDRGLLVRGRPAGGWRSNLHTYHLWGEWFPDVDLFSVGVEEAEEALLRLYLRALGPATVDDAAWWAGLPKGVIGRVAKRLADEVTVAGLSGRAGEYLLLGEKAARPRGARPSSQHVVNYLPRLDSLLMGYREREHLVDAESYGLVYDRSGNATSTILLDGRVAGVWDLDPGPEPRPRVKLFLFHPVDDEAQGQIEKQALKTGEFITGGEVDLERCASMAPLAARTAGGFMSPLRP